MLFLHISDLHFKQADVGQPDDPNRALRNDMVQDVIKMRAQIGASADGILVSGDVAFAGRQQEYDFAYAWLENELCPAAGCLIENVFVVPGNHDVDRSAEVGPAQVSARAALRQLTANNVDAEVRKWLRDRTSAAVIFGPIEHYNRFAAKFLCALRPYSDEALNGAALSDVVVRRDLGQANIQVLHALPVAIINAAVRAIKAGELNSAWERVIGDNAMIVLAANWPVDVPTTSHLAKGLALLRFPMRTGHSAEFWFDQLSLLVDDVTGGERTRFQAYLLKVALESDSEGSWKLVGAVLPELRSVILQGKLPNDVHRALDNDLPHYSTAAYWDINKRILIALSQLQQSVPNDYVLSSLDLSANEMHTVLRGAKEEEERSRTWLRWF
jgi:hypothetical protein